jgi:hypothetical protein
MSTQSVLPGPEPLLLDVRATARSLSITLGQARYLLKTGEIPYIRLGKKFLVCPEELKSFVARKKGERN